MNWQAVAIGVCVGMCGQAFVRYFTQLIARVVAKTLVRSSRRLRELVRTSNVEDRLLRSHLDMEK